MKRKLLTLALCAALALCALPMAAFAEGSTAQVKDESELLAAAANADYTTIELTADITLTQPVSFGRSVTLTSAEGGQHTLAAGDSFSENENLVTFTAGGTVNNLNLNAGGRAKYAIHAYNCAVKVADCGVSGGRYRGLLVNGASASADISNCTFSNNMWAAIEVASSSAGVPQAGCVHLHHGVDSIGTPLVQVDISGSQDHYAGTYVTLEDGAFYSFPIVGEKSLEEALKAAETSANKTVDLGGAEITLTAPLNVPADVTLKAGIINTDTSPIVLNEGSALEGLTINKISKTDLNIVQIAGNNAAVRSVNFNGQYTLGEGDVVRGVVPNTGVNGYTIDSCIFKGLRQPGYLEAPGTVTNCHAEGTRGWVVTQNHKVDFSGCTFTGNADGNTCNINIIPNTPDATDVYGPDELKALSNTNPGAYVIHQSRKAAMQDGWFLVSSVSGESAGTDLQKFATMDGALAMGEGAAVKLMDGLDLDKMLKLNVKGMTLDLNGFTITASGNFPKDADKNNNHLVDITADNVILKNGTLKAGSNNNHTLNVWNAQGVQLAGLTLDNAATYGGAPLVVGASDVTVNGPLKVVTGAKSWYGINVDSRNVGGAQKGASITVTPNVALEFEGQNPTGIYMENTAGMHGENVKLSFGSGVTFNSGIANFVPVVVKTGQSAAVEDPANAGLQDNGDGTFGFKPAPESPDEPSGNDGSAPAATPAPAPVLDSTPKTGAVSLVALPLAALALAGVGVALRKRR